MKGRATLVCVVLATAALAIGCSTKQRREHVREEASVEEPKEKVLRPVTSPPPTAPSEAVKAPTPPAPPPIASAPPPDESADKPPAPGDIDGAIRYSMKRPGAPSPPSGGGPGEIQIPEPGSTPAPPAPAPAKTSPSRGRCICLPTDPLCSC